MTTEGLIIREMAKVVETIGTPYKAPPLYRISEVVSVRQIKGVVWEEDSLDCILSFEGEGYGRMQISKQWALIHKAEPGAYLITRKNVNVYEEHVCVSAETFYTYYTPVGK